MSCKMLRCLGYEVAISVSEGLSASIFMAKDISVFQMEAVVSSEALVHIYQTIRCHSTEYSRPVLHNHHCLNVSCYRWNVILKYGIK
jgi:hypothetical protein